MERRKRLKQVSWHHSNPVADLFFEISILEISEILMILAQIRILAPPDAPKSIFLKKLWPKSKM